ncbi:hypothetical protein A4X06_0g614 [Tilletia controversa]|uniref:Peptidase M43 pregnancy-associated plasma-A domain-containing protein n=2 Tax=Tilletia TaxID=13289 RepID=A0A8X7MZW3_9BASI|nr:hypothetical protein A4X06_0g614 [Tilletia controversa]
MYCERQGLRMLRFGVGILVHDLERRIPTSASLASETRPRCTDGVVIYHATLAGGSFSLINLGRAATHEVGLWLGLYHVFEGGCSGNGDFVSDTPPQVIETSGCPSFQDPCPGGDPSQFQRVADVPCLPPSIAAAA